MLEEVHRRGLEFGSIETWGIPDRFMPFGARPNLLAEIELDVAGVTSRLRALAAGGLPRRSLPVA